MRFDELRRLSIRQVLRCAGRLIGSGTNSSTLARKGAILYGVDTRFGVWGLRSGVSSSTLLLSSLELSDTTIYEP